MNNSRILISGFLIVVIISPSLTLSPEDPLTIVNRFIMSRVGEEYFFEHYVPVKAEFIDDVTIDADYLFNYPPYVKGLKMGLKFDTSTNDLSEKWGRNILLHPQKILIDREEAIQIAIEGGIQPPSFMGYDASIRFDFIHSRLVWYVGSAEHSRKFGIDAETGKIIILITSNQNGHSSILTYISIIYSSIVLIISSYLLYRFIKKFISAKEVRKEEGKDK